MGKTLIIAILAVLSLSLTSISSTLSSKTPIKPEAEQQKVIDHTVKKGETLTELAEIYYQNPEFWTNIWNDNSQITNPSIIEPGVKVRVAKVKPDKVEDIDNKLMTRLLNDTELNKINPDLAFAGAGYDSSEDIPGNSAIKLPAIQNSVTQTPQSTASTSFDEVYKQAGDKYGIPWQVLYGLHLTETGQRDGAIFNGQGSGAQGPMQFMPGTWKAYGVDGNGDGVADINNAVDAIHGAANYLTKHGGVQQGLSYYGGNTSGTLQAACEKGFCL